MTIVALVIGIILIIVGVMLNLRYGSYEEKGVGWIAIGGILAFVAVVGIIVCALSISKVPEYNKKIEVYETEMQTIQVTINDVVANYLDHEKDTYAALTPENAIIFASIYPELSSSELVKRQLEIYNEYLVSIKNCKLALAEVSTAKWWLYFGH